MSEAGTELPGSIIAELIALPGIPGVFATILRVIVEVGIVVRRQLIPRRR